MIIVDKVVQLVYDGQVIHVVHLNVALRGVSAEEAVSVLLSG